MKTCCLIVLLALAGVVWGQPPDTVWTLMLGGNGIDFASDVIRLTESDIVICGSHYSQSPFGGFIAKITIDGDTLFTSCLEDSHVTDVFSVSNATNSAFLFSGSSFRVGHGTKTVLGKMSSSGALLWLRNYDELDSWVGYESLYDSNSQNTIVVGGYLFGGQAPEAVIFETDSIGDLLWSHSFGGVSCEHFESVVQSCDGGYVAAGINCVANLDDFGAFIAKVSADGDSIWANTLYTETRSWAHRIVITPDCGFLIAGECETIDSATQMLLIKTDSLGNLIWSRTYGGSDIDKCYDIITLSTGGYLLCGSTKSYGHGNTDTYLLNIDEDGGVVWSAAYGMPLLEYATSVVEVAEEDYIIAGQVQETGSSNSTDILIARIGTIQSTEQSPNQESVSSQSWSCYPNPLNNTTTIEYSGLLGNKLSFVVYDLLGRTMDVHSNTLRQYSTGQIIIDATALSSGYYFFKISDNQSSLFGRFMVIK